MTRKSETSYNNFYRIIYKIATRYQLFLVTSDINRLVNNYDSLKIYNMIKIVHIDANNK